MYLTLTSIKRNKKDLKTITILVYLSSLDEKFMSANSIFKTLYFAQNYFISEKMEHVIIILTIGKNYLKFSLLDSICINNYNWR